MKSTLGIENTQLKKILALLALNIFGIYLIYLLRNFINPFLGAVIFTVLFRKLMNNLVEKRGWKNSTSALLIIFISFFIILIPLFTLAIMLYSKISLVVNDPTSLLAIFKLADSRSRELFGFEIFSEETLNNIKSMAGNLIPSFLNQLAWTFANIIMMYFIMFYLLTQRNNINKELHIYLPFNNENVKILTDELESMTLSNVIGVPLIAIIQGSAAGLGYWIFGLSDPLFWAVITAFASIIPIVGSTIVWLPAALFILATGDAIFGIGMLVYGILIVVNIDNVARFIIQKRFADVHPLITVFGVLIGLNLFGLPGLIFGPLMLSYFVIFIKMYRDVYKTSTEVIVDVKL